jgi:3-oxoacyl-[acyl-carrier-protein] synthase II
MGEGCGVLVMESLEHAQKRGARIICEYMGGSTNCDAHHMTDPRPDGRGVAGCIKGALRNADLEPEAIHYINPHATSTLLGDVAEVKAMKQAFPNFKGCMSGTKSMIGHGLGAAAGLEAIATIKAITTGKVHPTLNQVNIIEEIGDWNTVPNVMQEHDIVAAMSNSFGFGGHNSSVVFAKFVE